MGIPPVIFILAHDRVLPAFMTGVFGNQMAQCGCNSKLLGIHLTRRRGDAEIYYFYMNLHVSIFKTEYEQQKIEFNIKSPRLRASA